MNNQRLAAGIGILLLTCLLCGLAYYAGIQAVNQYAEMELERAAHRVGTEPTLDGIADYIVKSVRMGMSRGEVERILGVTGPLRIERGSLEDVGLKEGPTACDTIFLKLSRLPGDEWEIIACYTTEDRLVHFKSADPDFPSLFLTR